ncbi:Chromodomain Y-like protein 2 [Harpegnathos saltator]|uniref:Chromodomain Y-like protein 2 n=1 Tax=Harpegnathos saltator TaxID=610380 RepID=E2BVK5_HARSA|nr:Chromodomain Y-like protein 2 [Harpegnathos saltator]
MLELGNTKTEAPGQFRNKEINVRRHGNLVQLILTPSSSTRVRNALTLQMRAPSTIDVSANPYTLCFCRHQVMQEFRDALSILNRDDKCRVVLLTATGTSFCEGLELSTLLRANKEERRSVAQELAHAVKEFIKSLATFSKPIVAGVQGVAVGLGVTMLPLFDLVIASDKATFSTPYAKLGQIAEGAAVYTLSHILGSPVTSELLLGGRTLTASEALRAGLVTRVLWPDRFQVELLPSLRTMGEQSSQSMEATKALLRHSLRKKLDAALESETYLLIQQWCSAECQTAIKAYIDGKIQ